MPLLWTPTVRIGSESLRVPLGQIGVRNPNPSPIAFPDGMHGTTRDLTDKQRRLLAPLIPEPPRREDGRGRPWKARRAVLNGILWVLRTGAPWGYLPERYPSYQTCHRRFQQWVRSGIMRGVLQALAEDLRMQGRLDVGEAYIDGSFAPAKKGAPRLARRSVARAQRSWPLQTAMVCR
jgi:transposase